MGRDGGVAVAAPMLQHQDVDGPTDHQLVARVRRGDERAFETLYHRYHRRITAYVLGMCKDHARAEDITQEIFVSALRRMRETERPIAFKPWVYEIAKNACIDQHRRLRRTEEVSLQAEDGLAPGDYGRLVNSDPTPDVAVVVKQDLDHLRGAFGGLSDTHHEILVMRELEGLSYRQIGERLGMSRPAVESTLFRARRRLTEEYDDLVSGQRCLRIQGIIATAARGRLGARDTSRLARHVAHCQPCRREAAAAGLDVGTLRKPLRTRVAAKVAAFLPFPLLGRRFGRGADNAAGDAVSGASTGWLAHAPMISDQLGAGWAKAAAAAAVLLAGVGAGVGTRSVTDSGRPAASAHAARAGDQGAPLGEGGAAEPAALVIPRARISTAGAARSGLEAGRAGGPGAGARERTAGAGSGSGADSAAPGAASPSAASGAGPAAPANDPSGPVGTPSKPSAPGAGTPSPGITVPAAAPRTDPTQAVTDTTQAATGAADGAVGAVPDTIGSAVGGLTNGATVPATDPVGGVVQGAADALDGVAAP